MADDYCTDYCCTNHIPFPHGCPLWIRETTVLEKELPTYGIIDTIYHPTVFLAALYMFGLLCVVLCIMRFRKGDDTCD